MAFYKVLKKGNLKNGMEVSEGAYVQTHAENIAHLSIVQISFEEFMAGIKAKSEPKEEPTLKATSEEFVKASLKASKKAEIFTEDDSNIKKSSTKVKTKKSKKKGSYKE